MRPHRICTIVGSLADGVVGASPRGAFPDRCWKWHCACRYLYPTESDGEALLLSETALTMHHLTPERNSLLYYLAIHHLAFATIFADERRRWSASVVLKRLRENGSADLVRAIALYRPQATWAIADADAPAAWSAAAVDKVIGLDDEQRLRLVSELTAA